MGELMNEGQNLGNDFDLTQFYAIFFEEAGENLDQMEQMLLALDVEAAEDEELNAIFRCAHSIKGGAATFGFADVAELTHQMESLLDKLRRHELKPTPPMVDVLLESSDALKLLLARHSGKDVEPPVTHVLVERISALAQGGEAPAPAATVAAPAPAPAPGPVAPPPAAPWSACACAYIFSPSFWLAASSFSVAFSIASLSSPFETSSTPFNAASIASFSLPSSVDPCSARLFFT